MAGEESRVKSFSCPSCSASLSIRGLGQTSTLACEYCGSIIDVTSDDYTILLKAQDLVSRPLIPLGTRGKILDTLFEVIGFLVRTDGSGQYEWREYLLFNPYKGFRWLSESEGHWSFLETVPDVPTLTTTSATGHPCIIFRENTYQRFLAGKARVVQVIGECYWRVEVGETVDVIDYIRPPELLSVESNQQERLVSFGTYLPAESVRSAFNLEHALPRARGVAPNQPNPYRARMGRICLIGTLFFFLTSFTQCVTNIRAANKKLLVTVYQHDMRNTAPKTFVTSRFSIPSKSNIEVSASADVDNSWVAAEVDLLHADGSEEASGSLEVSYYHGSDSDGSWSEGGRRSSMMFSSVPPGEYYLSMDFESLVDTKTLPVTIAATYDVPYWGNYVLTVVLIILYPIWLVFRNGAFEASRWSQSDYAGDD